MIKMIRGLRLLRGGRGRALRLGVVAVVVIWAWVALLSGGGEADTPTSPQGRVSRSPSLQVAPPISGQQSTSDHAPLQKDSDKQEPKKKMSFSEDVNPRYNNAALDAKVVLQPLRRNEDFVDFIEGDIGGDEGAKGGDGEGPDAREDFDEEDEDEEEEADEDDQGKWGGRNKVGNEEEEEEEEEEDEDAKAAKDNVALEEEEDEEEDEDEDEEEEEEEEPPPPVKESRKVQPKEDLVFAERVVDVNRAKLREKNHNLEEKRPIEDERVLQGDVGKEVEDVLGAKKVMGDGGVQEDDLSAVEEDFRARKMRVKEVCKKYNLGPFARPGSRPAIKHPPTPNYDVFYIDRNDGLAWCPIYKAASTTWLYNFILLGGLSESYVHNTKEQVSNVARKLWPPIEYSQADMALKVCLKFLIVRHPFERIVSAYRDKLENLNIGREHGVEHFYQKYGRKIVAKFRTEGKAPAKRYSQDMDDPSLPPPKGIEPTFEEFVRYLIDTDLVYYADDHWMPYYLHCTPCLVDYDVIAKFETLERDQTYVIRKQRLEDKIQPSWKHLTKGKKTSDTVKKYFGTITRDQLMKLYEKYKVDFELFNYSIDDYLSYVKHS